MCVVILVMLTDIVVCVCVCVCCQVTQEHAQKEVEWKDTILQLQNELQEKSDLLLSTEQVWNETILIKAHPNFNSQHKIMLIILQLFVS